MIRLAFIAGIGGFLGTVCRFLANTACSRWAAMEFPLSTFIVNITGCFIIGVLFVLFDKGNFLNESWRILLMIGFCGGFTTFSSFTIESIRLLQTQQLGIFTLYLLGSVILGLAATFAGIWIVKAIYA